MNLFLRKVWIGAMALVFITACNLPAQTPSTPQQTMPSSIAATATPTSLIPVTGSDQAASLQCQFCVNDEIHAVLLVPQAATFLVSAPVTGINCLTAQVVNDQRILICRGTEQTSFTLNVCIVGSNCSQLAVALEPCSNNSPTGSVTQAAPTVNASPLPTLIAATPTSPFALSTAVPTRIGATRSASTPTPASFQPATSTSAPAAGLQDPEGFVRWYFDAVWRQRTYQDL
ncbi:MAG TPA: hypothetical protein VIG57_22215, partial [Candidatus Entotheonella sp.]